MLNFFSSQLPPAVKRVLVVVFLLALRLSAAAQAPAWQSAQAVATATAAAASNYSAVRATAVDAAGNIFLAGNFSNTVVLGGTVLTSLGSYDVFVAKFNPANNQFVWAQRAGGTGYDYVSALVMSGTSMYIAGYFDSPTVNFGPTTLTNVGTNVSTDVFVAKLTDTGSTGSFAWAQRAGGTSYDFANALALSGTSVYVAGHFISSTSDFGLTTLTNAGYANVFVAKLTDAGSTGSFTWAQRAGGTGADYASALAVSSTGLYLAGNFDSPTANFGTAILTNVAASTGNNDVFVAKLVDAGSTSSFVWAQRAGGIGNDRARALAVSGAGVYVAGDFDGPTAGFGPTNLTNGGTSNIFVAKLSDVGSTSSFMWAQRAGGIYTDYATALVVSGISLYVAGSFSSPTANFGPTTLAPAGGFDLFVAKLTDTGTMGSFAWAQQAGGTGSDIANSLIVSGTSIHVAGISTSPTANFGPFIVSSPSNILGFLASLTDPTLTATTAALPREPASLFPNPARRTATLRLPAGTAPAPLTLTDALGRAVRRYPAPAGPEAALDLQGLPAGLYLLRGAGPAQRLAVE